MEGNTETISKKQHDEELRRVKEMYKPNNAFSVPFKSRLEFFKWWCVVLRPFIALTDRESDVVASFLNQRWELINSSNIKDPAILDALMMSSDTLDKVVKECKITKQHFYVVMSSLKKKKVINGRIEPRLIPNLNDDDMFKLTILFKKQAE